MKISLRYATAASTAIGLLLLAAPSHAQLANALKAATGATASSTSSLGGLIPGQSVTSSSLGNVAGVLQFCVKKNFMAGDNASAATSVKDSLVEKLGGSATSDSGFKAGARGIVDGGKGAKLDLSSSGLKDQVIQQVCDKILAQGKSML
jgi:Protein of unknown function (DUF2501)